MSLIRWSVPVRRAPRRPWRPFLLLVLCLLLLPGCTERAEPSQLPKSAESLPLPKSAPAASPAAEPPPAVSAEPAAASTAWNLILVNWENPLPEDFTVPELTQLRNGHAIDSRAYPALQAMMDAARAEGFQPLICSSYRTWDTQEKLFSNEAQAWLNDGYSQSEAEAHAAMWVARPGTSEHQTGLAVDIVDQNHQLLDEKQADTPAQQWLMAHCAQYGFILRYPEDKTGLTGVGYEPWHYRYVGVEAAMEITERGLCLEEYLAGIC